MKILTLLIVFVIFNTSNLFGQLQGQAKVDSLISELPKAKNDTNHVKLLALLADDMKVINPDKGIKYAKKGLAITEKLDWDKGRALCYFSFGANYSTKNNDSLAIINYEKALAISKKLELMYIYSETLNDIAMINVHRGNPEKAFELYLKSLSISEKFEFLDLIALTSGNIGNIYVNQSNYLKALKYFKNALKIDEKINNREGVSHDLVNIGICYAMQLNYLLSLENFLKALKILEKLGNKHGVANITINIGNLYKEEGELDKSLEYLKRGLALNQEIGDKRQITYALYMLADNYFARAKQIDSIQVEGELQRFEAKFKSDYNYNESLTFALRASEIADSIGLGELKYELYRVVSSAYEKLGKFEKGLEYHKKYQIAKDSIFSQENTEKLSSLEKAREDDVNKLKIEKQEILLKSQEDEKQLIIMSAGGALLAVLIILIVIINLRRKSEKLLLNILPASIAKRLKAKEENIADDFESATTIFIDLVGFTSFAKDKEASEVVKLLNKIFHRFDDLVNRHGLEKIKTMGDGYLAVSGVPDIDTNHCQKAINFALDIYNELEKFNKEMGLEINARVGLETGPLVAGVIGSSKFIYDIWGDSVNTASRMESTGTPGKIQITENVKAELEKQDNNFNFKKREPFEVKGKGLMQTYYLE